MIEEDLEKSKEWLADKVNKKNSMRFKELIDQDNGTMTKVKYWRDQMPRNLANRPEYINKLGRKQGTNILKVRSQMLTSKANMK